MTFKDKLAYYECIRLKESEEKKEFWSERVKKFKDVPYPMHKLAKKVNEEEYNRIRRDEMNKLKPRDINDEFDIDVGEEAMEAKNNHSLSQSTPAFCSMIDSKFLSSSYSYAASHISTIDSKSNESQFKFVSTENTTQANLDKNAKIGN